MTQLVFVHGVAARSGPKYDQAVRNRDHLFRSTLFRDPKLAIHTPLWGDLVPVINSAVYQTNKGVETFSLGVSTSGMGGGMMGGGAADTGHSLASVAQANPAVALDALFTELLGDYERRGIPIPDGELNLFTQVADAIMADEAAALSGKVAPDGIAALMKNPASDEHLIMALNSLTPAVASYGMTSAIGNAAKTITGLMRRLASSPLDCLADRWRPGIGMFLGDVFTYLRDSPTREQIRDTIRADLLAAHRDRRDGEKLVVISHSMGGVILLDMLCTPAAAGLPSDFKIDALITAGSQPGLFQALGLFLPPASNQLPKPVNVGLWLNVFDPTDPLAFRADPIFAGVQDLQFDSLTGIASAHTTYFKRPQFHARCRKRLMDHGIIPINT